MSEIGNQIEAIPVKDRPSQFEALCTVVTDVKGKLGVIEQQEGNEGIVFDWKVEWKKVLRGIAEGRIVEKEGKVYYNPAHLVVEGPIGTRGGGLSREAEHGEYVVLLGERINSRPTAVLAIMESMGAMPTEVTAEQLGQKVMAWTTGKENLPASAIKINETTVEFPSSVLTGMSIRLDTVGGNLHTDLIMKPGLVEDLYQGMAALDMIGPGPKGSTKLINDFGL